MATIRSIIEEYQKEIASTPELSPVRASECLVALTNLLGGILEQIRVTEVAYNRKLLACYEQEETANRAKIVANVSPEFIARQEARDTKEYVIEICRSLKYLLRAYGEDAKNYGGQ